MSDPTTGQRIEAIVVIGQRVGRINPATVAAALDGKATGDVITNQNGPATIHGTRLELMRRRPSLSLKSRER